MADRLDRVNQGLSRENFRLKSQFKSQEDDRKFLIKQLVAIKVRTAPCMRAHLSRADRPEGGLFWCFDTEQSVYSVCACTRLRCSKLSFCARPLLSALGNRAFPISGHLARVSHGKGFRCGGKT